MGKVTISESIKKFVEIKQQPLDYISSKKSPAVRFPQGLLYRANCLDILKYFPSNYIDTVITDPPYGLEFMGKQWDKVLPDPAVWKECLRILKPGGVLLCFGGTRTFHRITCAIEDAGFEIRDCIMWLYSSGFPKNMNISKAIDKKLGKEGEVVEEKFNWGTTKVKDGKSAYGDFKGTWKVTVPETKEGKIWDGYGTALKPAWEPIILAIKPCENSFADNALKYKCAGLNINACRIPYVSEEDKLAGGRDKPTTSIKGMYGGSAYFRSKTTAEHAPANDLGRWPANLVLDEEVAQMLDEQVGEISYGNKKGGYKYENREYEVEGFIKECKPKAPSNYGDSGGQSRFFYCAKASTSERNAGLKDVEEKITDDGRHIPIDNPYLRGKTLRKNSHPTVKPLKLMEYLCKLTRTPNGGIVLDPFLGSGTTALAAKNVDRLFIGVEKEKEYFEIAVRRIR